jgi:hypothetical protein
LTRRPAGRYPREVRSLLARPALNWGLVAIVLAQAALLALFAVDWKLPVALTGMALVSIVLLDHPLWGVGAMLAARLLSTGTLSFFSIGKINIGLFEPVLFLALGALGLRMVFARKAFFRPWPWVVPLGAILVWRGMGLFWCTKLSDGIKELVTFGVIVATTTVILAFVETWDDVKTMLWYWIGACVSIGLLAIFGDSLGLTDFSGMWKASSGGGRETGLGQQPNWFSMNLMFVVHCTAAFALVQKRAELRWGLLAAAVFIFFAQMTSGSRGGAYSIVIGGALVALGQPLFRRWAVRFGVVGGGLFAFAFAFDLGNLSKGFNRILNNIDVVFAQDIRGQNWAACIGMFTESWGIGIGPGGYPEHLAKYSWWLYNSVYRYPHGIFWGEMAHEGLPGLILLGWLAIAILRMAAQTIADCKGTEAEVVAWAMPASMAGYAAWSFVEFNLDEKPFWEWLALYTALHLAARRAKQGGRPLPAWTLRA